MMTIVCSGHMAQCRLHTIMLLYCFVCTGPALAACTKDYCSSSWPWGIYSCNYIYSFNRGTHAFVFLHLFSSVAFLFYEIDYLKLDTTSDGISCNFM